MINQEMKDIDLPELGSPEEFVDQHDIVKKYAEQDSAWTTKIENIRVLTRT
jgi:hypothetical protein